MSRRTTGSLPALSLGVVCLLALGAMLAAHVALAPADPPATRPAPAAAAPGANNVGPSVRFNPANMINMLRSRMEELKLSDEQKAKIDALFDKAIEEAKAIQEDATLQMNEKFPKIFQRIGQLKEDIKNNLDDKQKELFDKIATPGRGAAAGPMGGAGAQDIAKRFEEIMDKLDLSPEQKEKVAKASEEFRGKMTEVIDQIRANGGPSDETRQKIASMVADYRDKILSVLTDEQKTKMHELMPVRPVGAGGPSATIRPVPGQPAQAVPGTQP